MRKRLAGSCRVGRSLTGCGEVGKLGSGFGKSPNFLDCEVIVQLAEDPARSFGLKLRTDENRATHTQMFDLLRSAFVAQRPVRLDYITIGPRVGEIIRVANA